MAYYELQLEALENDHAHMHWVIGILYYTIVLPVLHEGFVDEMNILIPGSCPISLTLKPLTWTKCGMRALRSRETFQP